MANEVRIIGVAAGLPIDGAEQSVSVSVSGRWYVTGLFTSNYSGTGHNGAALSLRDAPAGGGNSLVGSTSGGSISASNDTQQYGLSNLGLDGSGGALSFDASQLLYAKVQSAGNPWPAGSTCDLFILGVERP